MMMCVCVCAFRGLMVQGEPRSNDGSVYCLNAEDYILKVEPGHKATLSEEGLTPSVNCHLFIHPEMTASCSQLQYNN